MKNIVINSFALVLLKIFRLAIINGEKIVAEGGNHEELLHHCIHVADAAEVFQSNILLLTSLLDRTWWLIVPSVVALNQLHQRHH